MGKAVRVLIRTVAFLAPIVLSGCSALFGEKQCCGPGPTEFDRAFGKITLERGFERERIEACFPKRYHDEFTKRFEATDANYVVYDKKRADGVRAKCVTTISVQPIEGTNRYKMTGYSSSNPGDLDCSMQALACLDPSAAQHLSSRFGKPINPDFIPPH